MTAPTATVNFTPLGSIMVAFGDPHFEPGLNGQHLALETKIHATWRDAMNTDAIAPIARIDGWVACGPYGTPKIGAMESRTITLRGYPASETLYLPLSDDQLLALDRQAGQQDVQLRVHLEATLIGDPNPPASADMAGLDGRTLTNPGQVAQVGLLEVVQQQFHPVASTQTPFTIRRSRWLEMLDQAGVEVALVLRLRTPLNDPALQEIAANDESAASVTQAANRLREARQRLRDGHPEQAIALCRKVLENIEKLVPLIDADEAAAGGKSRSQAKRWSSVYWAIKDVAHTATHDDDTTLGFNWRVPEATAVLAMTASLLVRYLER